MNYDCLEDKITDKLLDLSYRTGVSYSVLYGNWQHRMEVIKQIFPQHEAYKSRIMVRAYIGIKQSYEVYKNG